MIRQGSEAPDFEVQLQGGDRVRLSDYRGKKNVVLYFYPKDFTAFCTKQACTFSGHFREISSLNAVILGISADTVDSHRRFSAAYGLPFSLGADPNKTIIRMYDALLFGFRIVRVTYVIDRKGIVRGIAHHEVLIDNHWKSVVAILKGIEEHP